MSEQERMDRAKRIRRMREGQRSGDDADEPDTEDAADGGESDGEPTPDSDADEPRATDEDSTDAMAHVDDAVTDAVERVTGASASVPSPDEMGESPTDDAADATDTSDAADGETGDGTEDGSAEVGAAARAGIAAGAESTEPETRVLEFTLDEEQYCLDIEYVEEIVKREAVTRVPNTPEFVEGVVDLRGQITTILNPKVVIGTGDQTRGELLLVFDAEEFDEQGHLGWVVDDVRQVSPVSEEDVNDPPVEGDHIEGVIDRGDDEEFVVWTAPDLALDEAT